MAMPTPLAYVLQVVAGYHLNLSPKVWVPGFIGLTTFSVACELKKYGIQIDMATLAFVIVQLMIATGFLARDPLRVNGTVVANDTKDRLQ